ncbi:hypothetical protein C0J52_12048 [Blattella germanica]|nr:hypothetical protein C0J52_12048 [Blattella germanica]
MIVICKLCICKLKLYFLSFQVSLHSLKVDMFSLVHIKNGIQAIVERARLQEEEEGEEAIHCVLLTFSLYVRGKLLHVLLHYALNCHQI